MPRLVKIRTTRIMTFTEGERQFEVPDRATEQDIENLGCANFKWDVANGKIDYSYRVEILSDSKMDSKIEEMT